MNRRHVLAGTGGLVLTAASGCLGLLGDSDGTERNDDESIDAEAESLILTEEGTEAVIDGHWLGNTGVDDRPLMYRNADVVRTLVAWDEEDEAPRFDAGRVLTGVWLHDSVETSRGTYEDSPYQSGHGLEEENIAVESLAGIVEETDGRWWGYALLRDANVVGAVSYQNTDLSEGRVVDTTVSLDDHDARALARVNTAEDAAGSPTPSRTPSLFAVGRGARRVWLVGS